MNQNRNKRLSKDEKKASSFWHSHCLVRIYALLSMNCMFYIIHINIHIYMYDAWVFFVHSYILCMLNVTVWIDFQDLLAQISTLDYIKHSNMLFIIAWFRCVALHVNLMNIFLKLHFHIYRYLWGNNVIHHLPLITNHQHNDWQIVLELDKG